MNVFVGCESSGVMREAFRARGHNAVSNDLLPADDGSPFHIQGDVFDALRERRGYIDLAIFHPPCTDLAVSGAKWWAAKRADGRLARAVEFVQRLLDCGVPRIALENPVGYLSTAIRKPDQIIQPYQFGHMEQKKTCLWLVNLPKLVPTHNVHAEMMQLPRNVRERLHYLPPSPDRWKLRSKTYQGIANAMAEQWG